MSYYINNELLRLYFWFKLLFVKKSPKPDITDDTASKEQLPLTAHIYNKGVEMLTTLDSGIIAKSMLNSKDIFIGNMLDTVNIYPNNTKATVRLYFIDVTVGTKLNNRMENILKYIANDCNLNSYINKDIEWAAYTKENVMYIDIMTKSNTDASVILYLLSVTSLILNVLYNYDDVGPTLKMAVIDDLDTMSKVALANSLAISDMYRISNIVTTIDFVTNTDKRTVTIKLYNDVSTTVLEIYHSVLLTTTLVNDMDVILHDDHITLSRLVNVDLDDPLIRALETVNLQSAFKKEVLDSIEVYNEVVGDSIITTDKMLKERNV